VQNSRKGRGFQSRRAESGTGLDRVRRNRGGEKRCGVAVKKRGEEKKGQWSASGEAEKSKHRWTDRSQDRRKARHKSRGERQARPASRRRSGCRGKVRVGVKAAEQGGLTALGGKKDWQRGRQGPSA